MTTNQIRYWEMQEGKRHNVAQESENFRHNTATEAQAANELVETHRHNVSTETIAQGNLTETIRHNKETETVSKGELKVHQGQLKENIRHNKKSEKQTDVDLGIKKGQLKETERHNKKTEGQTDKQISENQRHNIAMEHAANVQASAAWNSSQAAKRNAETNAKELGLKGKQIDAQIKLWNKQGDKIKSEINVNKANKRLTDLRSNSEKYKGKLTAKEAQLLMKYGDMEHIIDMVKNGSVAAKNVAEPLMKLLDMGSDVFLKSLLIGG